MTALIGRSLKYFTRMTSEARRCLTAASLAMTAIGLNETASIGILSTGYEGWLTADQEYFRDYVAQGRSLGRANLFIYTLPTSAMSEVAIALALTGPTLHIQDDVQPEQAMFRQARSMVDHQEADGMLCVWSDSQSAICVVIVTGDPLEGFADFHWDQSATDTAHHLEKMCNHKTETIPHRAADLPLQRQAR